MRHYPNNSPRLVLHQNLKRDINTTGKMILKTCSLEENKKKMTLTKGKKQNTEKRRSLEQHKHAAVGSAENGREESIGTTTT